MAGAICVRRGGWPGVARRGQASNLSGRKLRPGMTNVYFRDTGLVSANTGSEFSHWSG